MSNRKSLKIDDKTTKKNQAKARTKKFKDEPKPLKVYNLLSLDREKDEPSWTTEKHDFWVIEKDGQFVIAVARSKATKRELFVLYQKGQPIMDSTNLENIIIHKDAFKATKMDLTNP